MKVLVTGGAGFVGSHVCEAFLAAGHEVVVVDCLRDFPAVMRNCAAFLDEIDFAYADILDYRAFVSAVFRHPFDCIVHLAAIPGVAYSVEHPAESVRSTIDGTLNVMRLAEEAGTRRIVFASSSTVYGGVTGEFKERFTGVPVCPYGTAKLAAEQVLASWAATKGKRVAALRLFSVYGPRMRSDLAMSRVADSVMLGEVFPMRGKGTSERDYTYAGDVAKAFVKAAEREQEEPFEAYNICAGSPVSLKAMVKAVEKALEGKAVIERVPDAAYDMVRTHGSNYRARQYLGWTPETDFASGVAEYAAWRREEALCS